MGLTAAMLLSDLGVTITIYADRAAIDTTSHKAGGQWAVSVVEFSGKNEEMKKILAVLLRDVQGQLGPGFGVYERSNFTASGVQESRHRRAARPRPASAPMNHARMPFEGHTRSLGSNTRHC